MEDSEHRRSRRKGLLATVASSILIALFPFPALIMAALRVPSGPVYLLMYVGWLVFDYFLARVSLRGWPVRLRVAASRGLKWPHPRVMLLSGALLFVWFLIWRIGLITDPVLGWSVWTAIIVVGYIEGAIVASSKATGTPPRLGALHAKKVLAPTTSGAPKGK